jgi:hypothetical protein
MVHQIKKDPRRQDAPLVVIAQRPLSRVAQDEQQTKRGRRGLSVSGPNANEYVTDEINTAIDMARLQESPLSVREHVLCNQALCAYARETLRLDQPPQPCLVLERGSEVVGRLCGSSTAEEEERETQSHTMWKEKEVRVLCTVSYLPLFLVLVRTS